MAERLGDLYHWSPTARRKQILRYGLRPSQRTTVSSGEEGFRHPHVCLSPSPYMAWSFSGGMKWTHEILEWDLWQVFLTESDEVEVRPLWGTLLEEIRVRNRIPKSRVWYAGTRIRG